MALGVQSGELFVSAGGYVTAVVVAAGAAAGGGAETGVTSPTGGIIEPEGSESAVAGRALGLACSLELCAGDRGSARGPRRSARRPQASRGLQEFGHAPRLNRRSAMVAVALGHQRLRQRLGAVLPPPSPAGGSPMVS
eukprot:3254155-Prymnesium_polylepis.1